MANKKSLLRVLVTTLVSGIIVVGCATITDGCPTEKQVTNVHEDVKQGKGDNTSNFKKVNDKLDILLAKDVLPEYDEEARMVPISMEIIERAKAENIDLSKLDYSLSATITVYINNTEDKLEIEDGKLKETKINQSTTIPITISNKGKMESSGKDFFGISFPFKDKEENKEGNIVLRFERNAARNRFDLVSASRLGKSFSLNFEDEKPYLVINYPYIPNNKPIEVQGVSALSKNKNGNGSDSNGSSTNGSSSNGSSTNGSSSIKQQTPVETVNCPEKIEGKGTLTPAAIVQFIMERNSNYSRSFLEGFIGAYFKEAGILGINPDLAIAQMCYTTKFLKNSDIMSTHNYAGFSTMPAGGRFNNQAEGIQAHIQHLKGYANEKYKPILIFDPRWDKISNFRGTVDNLDGLAKMWSPTNIYYADEISNIINDMRRSAQNGPGV